jgi:predicted glycogen debranching enzyme
MQSHAHLAQGLYAESHGFARHAMVASWWGTRRLRCLTNRANVTAIASKTRESAPAPLDREAGSQLEWLLTDGLGGYACGTAIELPTRRYHSWLSVARGDGRRQRLLAGVDEHLWIGGESVPVTPAHWRSLAEPSWPNVARTFAFDPVPTFGIAAPNGAKFERRIVFAHGRAGAFVQWRNTGAMPIRLSVRPLLACEDSDALLRERHAESPRSVDGGVELRVEDGQGSVFMATGGPVSFAIDPCWYRDFKLSVDEARGYDGTADRYAPGILRVDLKPGESAVVAFTVDRCEADPVAAFDAAVRARTQREQFALRGASTLAARLRRGVDDFFYRDRSGRLGVLAGFPWFSEWGRDAFVSLPGLTLSVGESERCIQVLRGALPFLRDGLLPNIYGDSQATSHYGSADAALWFSLCVQRVYDSARDPGRVRDEFGPALLAIAESYEKGAPLGLVVDQHGLLCAGSAELNATWMDARTATGPVTPRAGQPVEIVAMWCALLQTLGDWFGGRWQRAAKRANSAFLARFWNEQAGVLHDCRLGDAIDASIRPNMVIAAALRRSPLSVEQRAAIVAAATEHLRTPRGLRTLAPSSPFYRGCYEGGPDQRDHAYHQGTVWPWLAGFYVEASLRAAPLSQASSVARELSDWLLGFVPETRRAGFDHVSEVFDGDEPQRPSGTFAQAWNTGELLRALRMCERAMAGEPIGAGA